MKAKEYFEKYKDDISNDNPEKCSDAIMSLYSEMRDELFEIVEKRNIKYKQSFIDTVNEFNKKWNMIKKMFDEKTEIKCPMKQDAFKDVLLDLLEKAK